MFMKKFFVFLTFAVMAILLMVVVLETRQFPAVYTGTLKSTLPPEDVQRITPDENLPESIIPGTIIFSSTNREPRYTKLILMDGNGNGLSELGIFTGPVSWSLDGTQLAVGCEDPSKICLLDMAQWPDYHVFPHKPYFSASQLMYKSLDVPEECNPSTGSELQSISWSKDGDKLAIVCHLPDKSKVCILNLSGENDCWGDARGISVDSAVWSPVEDVLAVDKKGQILLTNEKGEKIFDLTPGSNPAWSPDGEQIAFAGYVEEGPRNGIAIIDKDGSNLKWLYRQPEQGEITEYLSAIDHYGSRISWSPDGKYLVYSACYKSQYEHDIFRQNIATGEIQILVDSKLFPYIEDVTWGAASILNQ